MGTLANAFVLLADQEDKEASTIIALKSAELVAEKKKTAEEKKKAEAKKKKKKKSSVKDGGRGKESSGNRYGRGDGPVSIYGYQREVSVRTVPLSKVELRERWLAREEENRKDMATMTLKEYEEQKKQKAEKTSVSVFVREATLDNTRTEQESKDETVKDSNLDKNGKSKDENCWKDKKVIIEGFFTDEDNTVKVRAAGPILDSSETSFPVLGKVTKPTKFYWE